MDQAMVTNAFMLFVVGAFLITLFKDFLLKGSRLETAASRAVVKSIEKVASESTTAIKAVALDNKDTAAAIIKTLDVHWEKIEKHTEEMATVKTDVALINQLVRKEDPGTPGNGDLAKSSRHPIGHEYKLG